MKVSYFPGCTLKNTAKDLDMYAYKSAEALGVTLEEIEKYFFILLYLFPFSVHSPLIYLFDYF